MNLDPSVYIYIIAALVGWIVAQLIKFTLSLHQDGLSWGDLVSSGGMPSAHASFVSSVAITVGVHEGFESSVFGVALVLLGVVVYDATGVRRATGENTKVLGAILKHMKIRKRNTALHLALGHTPYQAAAGVLVGIICGLAVHLVLG